MAVLLLLCPFPLKYALFSSLYPCNSICTYLLRVMIQLKAIVGDTSEVEEGRAFGQLFPI